MQYFAQDEATRLDPTLTVYETLEAGSPDHMVPAIRNILGGFLFSGDDVYKKAGVLSGGERTRLAVARMLLRPSNTLLLDEPTNHLDLDSKDVLLDALEDYGGTLIFVSHDRYFVETPGHRIIEVGGGEAHSYPGTYEEFLWSKAHSARSGQRPAGLRRRRVTRAAAAGCRPQAASRRPAAPAQSRRDLPRRQAAEAATAAGRTPEGRAQKRARPRLRPDARRRSPRGASTGPRRRTRPASPTSRAASPSCEAAIKELEAEMSSPGFYDDRAAAQPVIDRHQALMWEVGDLMHQWEALQRSRAVV